LSTIINRYESLANRRDAGHTPPDLVIEVDISRSSIRKLPIFATFHVTEVWQYQNASLTAYRLQDGTYVPIAESTVLPGFPLAQIQTLLDQRTTIGETQLIRSFRETLKGLATE
jgi:Uma2 family endonuclease